MILNNLKTSVGLCGSNLGFEAKDVPSRPPPRRWCHVPNLLRSRQRHHKGDWPLAQKQYSQVTPHEVRSTHEELLAAHTNACQIFLYAAPGGGALLLILTFIYF